MAKNTMNDLRDHLFEQIENLKDAKSQQDLQTEVERAKAMCEVSGQILESAKVDVAYMRSVGNSAMDARSRFFDPQLTGDTETKQLTNGKRR